MNGEKFEIMNKGSAYKWIELIKSGKYEIGSCIELCYSVDEAFKCGNHFSRQNSIYYSWVGILEDFICNFENCGESWTEISFKNFDGTSTTRCSEKTLKAVKAKTDLFAVDDLYWMKPDQFCGWLEENYQTL